MERKGTPVPRYAFALLPWCTGAVLPWCPFAPVPWCPFAPVPSPRGLGYSILSDGRISVIIQNFCHCITVWSLSRPSFGAHAPCRAQGMNQLQNSCQNSYLHDIFSIYSIGPLFSRSSSLISNANGFSLHGHALYIVLVTVCGAVAACYFYFLSSLRFELRVEMKRGGLRSAISTSCSAHVSLGAPTTLSFLWITRRILSRWK